MNTIQEAEKRGSLPESMRNGDIAVLYKKNDPAEVRHYRPVTLLNVDYKIYAKIMSYRMRKALDYFVSKEQLGFVPGRIITEASHLTRLVQAYLDETDEEGLLVAMDWEKAFDRVSWDFLHDSYEALGFGPKFRFRAMLMANPDSPPARTVKIAGERGQPFEIHSGVPQGCPYSPLAFLVCAEALTRAVKNDPDIVGITIGDATHVIGQFADDTLMYLRGYTSLGPMWKLIHEYEDASGHRANIKKFEGLRCGATRRIPPPTDGHNALIQWAGTDWVRLLGIPFWEDNRDRVSLKHITDAYWDTLYKKIKKLMAGWKRHVDLTIFGRVLLANMMVFSRIRYPSHCMEVPKYIYKAIVSDTQALLWEKDYTPDPALWGSDLEKKRWMKEEAQTGKPRTHLGVGLLDIGAHLKALRVKQLLAYVDASQGAWKQVLDCWFQRTVYGRGAVFTRIHTAELTSSITHRPNALPKFWVKAVKNLRELTLTPLGEPSKTGALGQPVFDNPCFTIPHNIFRDFWREKARVVTVRDLLTEEGEPMRWMTPFRPGLASYIHAHRISQ